MNECCSDMPKAKEMIVISKSDPQTFQQRACPEFDSESLNKSNFTIHQDQFLAPTIFHGWHLFSREMLSAE